MTTERASDRRLGGDRGNADEESPRRSPGVAVVKHALCLVAECQWMSGISDLAASGTHFVTEIRHFESKGTDRGIGANRQLPAASCQLPDANVARRPNREC